MRNGGPAAMEHAGEVRVDDAVPLVVRHPRDGLPHAHSGVVHQDVQAAEARDDGSDREAYGRVVSSPSWLLW
jgi:hypothetical protein